MCECVMEVGMTGREIEEGEACWGRRSAVEGEEEERMDEGECMEVRGMEGVGT